MAPSPNESATTTPPIVIVATWLVVLGPLLWGVLQTLKKAAALFQ